MALLAMAVMVSGELNLCRRKTYIGRAEQADDNGKKCWDNVKVPFCSGRCDSREVSYQLSVVCIVLFCFYQLPVFKLCFYCLWTLS